MDPRWQETEVQFKRGLLSHHKHKKCSKNTRRPCLWAPEAGRKGTAKTDRRELQQTTLEKLFSLVARQDWLYLVRWNCLAKESLFYGGGDW